MDLELSDEIFSPGEQFLLKAYISNPGPETYSHQALAVLLDVYGLYFWYPAWTSDFGVDYIDLGVEILPMELLAFEWPEVSSGGSGVYFYGALLDETLTGILGDYDVVSFGWEAM